MLLLGGEQSPWLSSVWRNGRAEWWRVGCITRKKERCEWRVIRSGLVIRLVILHSYTFTRPYDHKFQYSAYTAQYTSLYSRPHGCRGGTNTSLLVTFVTHNPHHQVYHHHHRHQQHRIQSKQKNRPQVRQHKKVLSHLASPSAPHRPPVNSAKMRSSTAASPSPSSAPS